MHAKVASTGLISILAIAGVAGCNPDPNSTTCVSVDFEREQLVDSGEWTIAKAGGSAISVRRGGQHLFDLPHSGFLHSNMVDEGGYTVLTVDPAKWQIVQTSLAEPTLGEATRLPIPVRPGLAAFADEFILVVNEARSTLLVLGRDGQIVKSAKSSGRIQGVTVLSDDTRIRVVASIERFEPEVIELARNIP